MKAYLMVYKMGSEERTEKLLARVKKATALSRRIRKGCVMFSAPDHVAPEQVHEAFLMKGMKEDEVLLIFDVTDSAATGSASPEFRRWFKTLMQGCGRC